MLILKLILKEVRGVQIEATTKMALVAYQF